MPSLVGRVNGAVAIVPTNILPKMVQAPQEPSSQLRGQAGSRLNVHYFEKVQKSLVQSGLSQSATYSVQIQRQSGIPLPQRVWAPWFIFRTILNTWSRAPHYDKLPPCFCL